MGIRTFGARIAKVALSLIFACLAGPAWAQSSPKYSADVPPWITTPDVVDSRTGTSKFHNGAPDEQTIQLVYDNLGFSRGVQAFLAGISATSVRAACNGTPGHLAASEYRL